MSTCTGVGTVYVRMCVYGEYPSPATLSTPMVGSVVLCAAAVVV